MTARVTNAKDTVEQVQRALEHQFMKAFFLKIQSTMGKNGRSGNKLRMYRRIKLTYTTEIYLLMQNIPTHVRRAIAQFRVSNHTLESERGRMAKPRAIPAEERFCRQCKTVVEDEIHFITECPLYRHLRVEML